MAFFTSSLNGELPSSASGRCMAGTVEQESKWEPQPYWILRRNENKKEQARRSERNSSSASISNTVKKT
jgi:hypothetical protein